MDFTPNFELGLYESIISAEANINYFNPLIFYRAVEQQRGSPDNILLGLDFRWNLRGKYQLYGQFMLDEFLISELRSGGGSWRNKFGGQLGAKYIDAFDIPSLDLQMEFNLARPFHYAYEDPALSYTNYRNPLAHPLGANFREIVMVGRYQPLDKLTLVGKLIYADQGLDDGTNNFGGDLLKSTDTRISDSGNSVAQGVSSKTTFVELRGSYMLWHNVFADLRFNFRSNRSLVDTNSTIANFSLRWNLPTREHEF